jgi:hypothetical protein
MIGQFRHSISDFTPSGLLGDGAYLEEEHHWAQAFEGYILSPDSSSLSAFWL